MGGVTAASLQLCQYLIRQLSRPLFVMDPQEELSSPILGLPEEILDQILKHCVPFFAKPFTVDLRSSLSVQSYTSQPPPINDDGKQPTKMSDWVLVCKKFREAGRRRQFRTLVIRCSDQGFKNLKEIIKRPELAKCVKKFSYMVYGDSSLDRSRFEFELEKARERTEEARRNLAERNQRPLDTNRQRLTSHQLRTRLAHCESHEIAIRNMMMRSDEQQKIISEGTDGILLLEAMQTFTGKLEQIRLMRCEDAVEVAWHKFARSVPDLADESKSHRWSRAYEHASQTLTRAFNESDCQIRRISGRALPPETSLLLASSLQSKGPKIAMRLTCLELQFDDRPNLDEEITELSELFQQGFNAAINVQGLHIGFTRPVSIAFKTVFHNVHWENLRYVGFGAWRLNSEDIIGFVRRHKRTLRSIRLRGVLLNEGSTWLEVLKILRLETMLKWASFRGVGYSGQERTGAIYASDEEFDDDSDGSEDFPETQSPNSTTFAENGRSEDNSESEGDRENEDEDEDRGDDEPEDNDQESHEQADDSDDSLENEDFIHDDTDDEIAESVDGSEQADSEQGQAVNDYAIDDQDIVQHTNIEPDQQSECNCGNGFAWADLKNADDHGRNPPTEMWKWWQSWVVKRCPIHDPAASVLW